jgi:hypothetical protein
VKFLFLIATMAATCNQPTGCKLVGGAFRAKVVNGYAMCNKGHCHRVAQFYTLTDRIITVIKDSIK